jgi:hypothetical protein
MAPLFVESLLQVEWVEAVTVARFGTAHEPATTRKMRGENPDYPWIRILPIPPFTSRSTRFSAVLKSGEMYSLLTRV